MALISPGRTGEDPGQGFCQRHSLRTPRCTIPRTVSDARSFPVRVGTPSALRRPRSRRRSSARLATQLMDQRSSLGLARRRAEPLAALKASGSNLRRRPSTRCLSRWLSRALRCWRGCPRDCKRGQDPFLAAELIKGTKHRARGNGARTLCPGQPEEGREIIGATAGRRRETSFFSRGLSGNPRKTLSLRA